ncbi:MAG TPA: phospholipase D-like domain-containing protein [Acidimicrobiales bacterium]|nr:phospholipase D-like domain-containing protein [Acidimicrobiales bacterium]
MTYRLRAVAGGVGLGLGALLARNLVKYKRATSERFDLLGSPQPGTPEFAHLVEAMTGATQRPGNRVQVMRNGTTLDAMVDAISKATRTVEFSSYIYWPGPTADCFSAALAERARAGVAVNLLLDGYGSAKLDRKHQDRLRGAGVHVATYRPPRWHTLHKLNNRMHRRILLVDGTVGFAGGVGIADVWTGDAEDPEHWRETHLRIEGPVLRELYGAFLETWAEATGKVLANDHIPEDSGFDDGVDVVVSRSTPTGWATATTLIFYAAIAGARQRLWLTTAYFVPDRAFEDLLCATARRGGRRPAVDQRPARRQGGGPPSRSPLLRQAPRCRGADLRVRPDDAPRQGDRGRRRLGQRGVGQLRQPLTRSRLGVERRRGRPGLRRRARGALPRRPHRVAGDRSADLAGSSPAHPGQRACDRAGAPVIVSDSLWTDSDEAAHEAPAVAHAALVGDILAAVAEEQALDAMLARCAEAVVGRLGAAFARVWTLDAAADVLELQASAGMYTHLDGEHSRVPVGELKIGRIAEERAPHLTNDVLHDPRISDYDWARREGHGGLRRLPAARRRPAGEDRDRRLAHEVNTASERARANAEIEVALAKMQLAAEGGGGVDALRAPPSRWRRRQRGHARLIASAGAISMAGAETKLEELCAR